MPGFDRFVHKVPVSLMDQGYQGAVYRADIFEGIWALDPTTIYVIAIVFHD
ncbi:hypothetical protein D3C76_1626550 [compost metagenome]